MQKLQEKFLAHKKYIFATIVAIVNTIALNAHSITIDEAIIIAYDKHEDFKINQQDYLSSIQTFSEAFSTAFMPKVSFGIRNDVNKSEFQDRNISRDNLSSSLSINQQIFSSGSDMKRLEAENYRMKSAMAAFYSREQRIVTEVIKVYLDLLSARDIYKLSEKILSDNRIRLEGTKAKYRLGQSTKVELYAAEAKLAKAESEMSKRFAALQVAKITYEKIFGETDDPSWPEITKDNDLPKTFEEFATVANENNFDIKKIQNDVQFTRSTSHASMLDLLPSITLSAGINKNPIDSNKNKSVSISLNVPILSKGGAEYAQVRRSRYQARKATYSLSEAQKTMLSNIRSLWESFNNAKITMEASKRYSEAADIAYNAFLMANELGQRDIFDVLNKQEDKYSSHIEYINVKANYISSYYALKQMIGSLTGKQITTNGKYFDPIKELEKNKIKIIGF